MFEACPLCNNTMLDQGGDTDAGLTPVVAWLQLVSSSWALQQRQIQLREHIKSHLLPLALLALPPRKS